MARKHQFDYDLIVIGSGAGGSAAANIVAGKGKRVAIVEAEAFGGESPNWSDVPINSLLHVANILDEAKQASKFGLRTSTLGYNYPSIRAWKDLAVKRTGAGGNRKYYESQGIDTFNDFAHFISPNEISVNRRHISAEHFLIATGADWAIPEIIGLENIKYLTPRTILEEIRPPKSLLIVGGGDSGVEIAQLMSTFGTKVYIIEKASRLLPHHDNEIGEMMEKILSEQKGVSVLSHSRVISVEKDGLLKRVVVNRADTQKIIKVDEILIAAGRNPRVDLGLENAGVKYSAKGIDVNEYLQTNVKHIYAAGDCLGRDGHTHSAILESRVVASNVLNKQKIMPNYTATTELIFTNPEVATVGLSEDDCAKRDMSINKAIAPLNIIARSNTSDFRDGFVKIITDKKGIVLGAAIIAPRAGEMIHELAIAAKYGLSASQIADTPHAFLSWSEAIRVCASKLS